MRNLLFTFGLSLALASPAAAQRRPAHLVPELSDGALSSLLSAQQHSVERCAARTGAYVATLRADVSPGPAPSTLYNARISVSVASRPRDPAFESCVRREVRDALRRAPYAVGRGVRARHTFRIAERPPPPIERPAPPFDEGEVRRALSSHQSGLQQCLRMAGVPEQITLRVAVRPDGRLVLTSADLPPGAAGGALSCLAGRVSRLAVAGRPARTVTVVHRIAVQNRAY